MKSLARKTTTLVIIILCILCVCFTQVFAAGPVVEPGAGTNYYTQQEVDKQNKNTTGVNTDGAASYSYPMSPVSLMYSSNGGWALAGYSMITQNIKNGVPKYGATDTFLLDGEDLVLISQSSAQNEYRTRRDSLKKIYQNFYVDTQTNKTISKWEVHNPDGGVSYYEEQVFAPDRASGKIRKWALSRSLSRGNYNVVYYKYTQDSGETYLTAVISGKNNATAYTATTISYVQGIYNLDYSYIYGSLVIKDKLRPEYVKSYVNTDVNGGGSSATAVGGYKITYTGDEKNHAVVNSITQLGTNMTSTLPSVTFDYYDFSPSFTSTATPLTIPGDTYSLRQVGVDSNGYKSHSLADFVDVNGDGLPDRVSKNRGDSFMRVWLNSGSGFGTGAASWTTADNKFLRDILFTVESYPGEESGKMYSQNVFIDFNGDGLPDRVSNVSNRFDVQLNNGAQFQSATSWTRPNVNGIDFSAYYHNNTTNEEWTKTYLSTLDMDGDGRADCFLVNFTDGSVYVYHNNGSSFDTTPIPFNGLSIQQAGFRATFGGGLTAYDLMDINGDGLYDWVTKAPSVDNNKLKAIPNNGSGFTSSTVLYGSTDDKYLRSKESTVNDVWDYVDMNGDGMPDRVSKASGTGSTLNVWLNAGISSTDFQSGAFSSVYPASYTDDEALRSDTDYGTDTDYIDMNGDGLPDRVKKQQSSNTLNIWYNTSAQNGGPAGKLREVRNGNGGTTTYTYKSYKKAYDKNMKPNMWVVNTMIVSDGLGNSYATTYDYSDGVYDVRKKEFRGFGTIKKTEPTGDYTITGYYTDEYLKGIVNYVDTYDSVGSTFKSDVYMYTSYSPGTRNLTNFPAEIKLNLPTAHEVHYYYGGVFNAKFTHTEYTYEFDTNGCISKKTFTDFGEATANPVTDTGKDKYQKITTYTNDASLWVVGLEKITDIWGYEGNTSTFQRQAATKNTYGSNDNLTKTERWNGSTTGTLDPNSTSWVNPTTYEYDAYGNVTKTTEPEGVANGGYFTQTTYDSTFHSFPLTTTNAMGHSTQIQYDGCMRPRSVKDVNNNITFQTTYDQFGRISMKWGPLCSSINPNEYYTYTNAVVNADGSISKPAMVTIQKKQDPEGVSNKCFISREMYDGLGRVVQAKTRYNYISTVSKGFTTIDKYYGFDGNKTFTKTSAPYVTPTIDWSVRKTDQPCSRNEAWFDTAGGNKSRTVNTDNTEVTTVESLWVTTITNANGVKKQEKRDGQGRVIQEVETNGQSADISTDPTKNIYTSYEYKSGTGARIKLTDTKNSVTTTTYNMLGQVTEVNDPNTGRTQFIYNANGAVTQKITSNGYTIRYLYDNMGRNTRIDYPNTGTQINCDVFYYDTISGYDNTKTSMKAGKLLVSSSIREDQCKVYDTYYYDTYGNVKEKSREIFKSGSNYNTATEKNQYDLLNRVVRSNVNGEDINYIYNDTGKVMSVREQDDTGGIGSKYGTNTSIKTNQYATLYDTKGVLPKFTTNTIYGNGGYWTNFQSRTTFTYINPINNASQNLTYIKQGVNAYAATERVIDNWITILIKGSGTTAASLDDFKIGFYNRRISINDAIAQGFIEPLVIVDSYKDTNAWQNPITLADGTTATETKDYPCLAVTFKVKDKECFFGLEFTSNKAFNNTSDGFSIIKYAPNYDITLFNVNYYVSDAQYTDTGAMKSITYGSTYTTNYTYYDTGTTPGYRLKTIEGPSTTSFKNTLTYDNIGNITAIQDLTSTNNQTFAYDKLDRLTSATGIYGTQTYTYDVLGNILQDGTYGTLTYSTTKPQQVTGDPLYTYQYDNAGNLTRKTAKSGSDYWTYEYDWNNNLTKLSKNGTTIMTALYDPYGSRVRKSENNTTEYYFSSSLEKKETSTREAYQYNYFAGVKRVARKDWDNVVTYYFQDHLGNDCRIIKSDGSQMNQYLYAPYGKVAQESGTLVGKYKYNDRELDATGLYCYGARYYDPVLGRFISADSLISGGGYYSQNLNRYAYCIGNPVKYIDPNGHQELTYPDMLFINEVQSTMKGISDSTISSVENIFGQMSINHNGVRGTTHYTDNISFGDSTHSPSLNIDYMSYELKTRALSNILDKNSSFGYGGEATYLSVNATATTINMMSNQAKLGFSAEGKMLSGEAYACGEMSRNALKLEAAPMFYAFSGKVQAEVNILGIKISGGLEGYLGGVGGKFNMGLSSSGFEFGGSAIDGVGGGWFLKADYSSFNWNSITGAQSATTPSFSIGQPVMPTYYYAPPDNTYNFDYTPNLDFLKNPPIPQPTYPIITPSY